MHGPIPADGFQTRFSAEVADALFFPRRGLFKLIDHAEERPFGTDRRPRHHADGSVLHEAYRRIMLRGEPMPDPRIDDLVRGRIPAVAEDDLPHLLHAAALDLTHDLRNAFPRGNGRAPVYPMSTSGALRSTKGSRPTPCFNIHMCNKG